MVTAGRFALVAAAVLVVLAAAGCSGGDEPAGPTATPLVPVDGVVNVQADEWGFEPQSILIEQDQEVEFILNNTGGIIHNLKVDDLLVEVISQDNSGGFSGDDDELLVGADRDDIGTLIFVPLEAGEYEFYCSIANHRQLGMKGLLIVQ